MPDPAYVTTLADELTNRHPSLLTPDNDLSVLTAELALAQTTHPKPPPEKPRV